MSHDAELDELVRRFQTLQRDEIPSHISERNVVEIVNVLLKRHLVELLYTTDAKEYLTWDELKKEIVEEVWANEGRLNVVDLPGLLSVHTHQVERVLPDILKEERALRIENGELMTDTYLSRTIQSLEDALKEQGFLSVVQFATTNRFSSAFARRVIDEALRDGQISAVMEESILYTKEFVSVQKRMLRACLLAQHQPADVKELMKRNDLFTPLVDALVEAVAPELPGTFTGYMYIPTVFESYRTSQVENIYKSNGFVEYATLQALGLSNPRQYMRSRFNDPATIVDTAEPVAHSTGSSGGGGKRGRRKGGKSAPAKDVPTGRRVGGGDELVRATAEYPLCGYALSTCFVSDRFLNSILALQGIADKETLALDVTAHLPSHIDVAEDWPVVEPRLHELFPGLAECELVEDMVLVHKDAKNIVMTALKEALASGSQGAATSGKSRKKAATSDTVDPVATARTVVATRLALPEDTYGTVVDTLVDGWSGAIEEIVEAQKAAGVAGAAAQLRQSRSALQAGLATRWIELSLAAKGVQWSATQLDADTHTALSRHLLSTAGYDMVRDILANESLDTAELCESVSQSLAQVSTFNQLPKVVKLFPTSAQSDLTALVTAGSGKSVEGFMGVLQELSATGAIAVSSFHQPNKKVERETYAKLRDGTRQQVEQGVFVADEVASGELFAVVCMLFVHTLARVHLPLPGKSVGAVVDWVKKTPGAPTALLEQGLHAITTALQCHTPLTPESIQQLEELRASAMHSE